MDDARHDLMNRAFALLVVVLSAYVVHRFLLPLLWAGVLCLTTWPALEAVVQRMHGRRAAPALLLTVFMAALLLVPASYGVLEASREAPALARFVAEGNSRGVAPPAWLDRLPYIGGYAQQWWSTTLGQPHGLAHLFASQPFGRFGSTNEVLRSLGVQATHRLVDIGFTFLCLFFMYKDGAALRRQIRINGMRFLGASSWDRYMNGVPAAIRATVNGLVFVGLAEGVFIGIAYFFTGMPSPVLWAIATGVLAIIPFGAPLVYGAAALFLLVDGHVTAAAAIAAWGSVVLFVADHFVRPTIIGNATRLPFLAVLFGILGGVESFGLIGLFIGPAVMTLFITLWRGGREPPPPDEVHTTSHS
jgi:predicted PurR-regulated permease PerM